MSARDMDARTKNGESARSGPRAASWRPVPWEVITLMLTMVMVGAVVGGLTLAAFGEVREDIRSVRDEVRALGMRVTAVEHRVAAVETRIAAVEQRIAAVENRVAAVENRVAAVENRVAGVEREVAKIAGWIEGSRETIRESPPAKG